MFKKVAKTLGKPPAPGKPQVAPTSGGRMGVLPKGIKETKVGKINPNLVGKPKPGVAPTSGSRMGGKQSLPPPKVGGKRSLPPMPTKVPAGLLTTAATSGVRTGPMRPGVAPATSKPLRG